MQRPLHGISQAEPLSSRRLAGIGFAAALNIAFVWALTTGLAQKIVLDLPHDLEVSVIRSPDQVQPAVAPPKPNLVQPQDTATVAPPEIQIDTQQAPAAVTAAAQPTPPSDNSISGVSSTHTTPPYPAMARRLGEQGVVVLHLTISPQGDVISAQVTKSSGYSDLDQTASSWVMAHWKYKPAVQNGVPVPSATDAAVKFDLKNA